MEDKPAVVNFLSEHYRDTCEIVRARERRRERLLLIIGVLLALTLLQIQGEEESVRIAQELARGYIDPDALRANFSILKGAVWAVLVVLVQAYYQTDVFIERTYPYIHRLENEIGSVVGRDVMSREGASYESSYPYFLWWTWYFYKWLVPLAILLVPTLDLAMHISEHGVSAIGSLFRMLMTGIIVATTVLYLLLVHSRK